MATNEVVDVKGFETAVLFQFLIGWLQTKHEQVIIPLGLAVFQFLIGWLQTKSYAIAQKMILMGFNSL